ELGSDRHLRRGLVHDGRLRRGLVRDGSVPRLPVGLRPSFELGPCVTRPWPGPFGRAGRRWHLRRAHDGLLSVDSAALRNAAATNARLSFGMTAFLLKRWTFAVSDSFSSALVMYAGARLSSFCPVVLTVSRYERGTVTVSLPSVSGSIRS